MPRYGRVDPQYFGHLASAPIDRDGPVLMVNFMKYFARAAYQDGSDRGLTGREADDAYSPVDVLARIGAVPVFFADVEPGGEWDRVGIVRYPTRRSFVEMQSRQDFREKHQHKEAGMERTIVSGALPTGVRPRGCGLSPRVIFEMVTEGTSPALENAARLRVEGTILGDGRRFAELAVAWVTDDATAPVPSDDRVVAVTRPTVDRLSGELATISPAPVADWS